MPLRTTFPYREVATRHRDDEQSCWSGQGPSFIAVIGPLGSYTAAVGKTYLERTILVGDASLNCQTEHGQCRSQCHCILTRMHRQSGSVCLMPDKRLLDRDAEIICIGPA